MNIFQTIKKVLGSIIFDDSMIHEGIKILHITDTPTTSYNAIMNLIDKIEPDYIIHTGDLADNIKLEIYPEKIDLYKKKVKKLISALEGKKCESYIAIGNHDDYAFIREQVNTINTIKIIKNFEQIEICKKKFLITHKLEDIFNEKVELVNTDYILHGHSFYDELTDFNGIVLNGLKGIYLIYPEQEEIFHIDYPMGTNDSRMQRFGTGI